MIGGRRDAIDDDEPSNGLRSVLAWAVDRALVRLLGRPDPSARPDPRLEQGVWGALAPLPPGVTLTVSRYRESYGRGARVVVGGACPQLTVTHERGGHLETGDPRFDTVFFASGPPAIVRALLDSAVRLTLLKLDRLPCVRPGSTVVHDGRIAVDVPLRPFADSARACVEVAAEVLGLIRRVQSVDDLVARLGENALYDPVSEVRMANLNELVDHFRDVPETAATLRAALSSHDSGVRLAAALALGAEGRFTLEALAAGGPDGCAAAAIEAMDDLPVPELEKLLASALTLRVGARTPLRPTVACACIDRLGRPGEPEALELIIQALAARHSAVAFAAVRALRRMGTVAVVAPLRDAAASHPDHEVRRAALDAVEDVQMGLTDAAPGQLSLSGGEAGAVSLAEDASGRVSLPPAKGPP